MGKPKRKGRSAKPTAGRRKSCLRTIGQTLLIVVALTGAALFLFTRHRMKGPYREYEIDKAFVSAPGVSTGAPLMVGVAKRDITPDMAAYDPWQDNDGNTKFEIDRCDTWEDRNGNGDFDFVWLAGFNSNRPALGVNDPLWSRAIAFRHLQSTIVLVTIDCVGLTHERIIRMRKALLTKAPEIDHIVFSATHTHDGPDTMGIWSYRPLMSKFDEDYLNLVLDRTEEAVVEAVANLQPSAAACMTADLAPEGFVHDSRMPEVFDRNLCIARFNKLDSDETIATLVSWGNHPEGFGSDNSQISSDFAHYWREGVEAAAGGMCLYFQGPVGGLMTPLHLEVPVAGTDQTIKEDGLEKVKNLGQNLAARTVEFLASPELRPMEDHRIAAVAKTIYVSIDGPYKYPVMFGLIHPGWYGGKAKTEVSALRIGDLEILTCPGEIYPEIVDGGIESPEGADFPGDPVEVPPLRPEMGGRVKMVFNLANDELGYLIPRTQWDEKHPYTYGDENGPYGEENSGGPNIAAEVHRASLAVVGELAELVKQGQAGSSR